MKLSEALQIINVADAQAKPFRLLLACGFTPLHLQTFLTAHLQQSLPQRKVVLDVGLYGDLLGTLRKPVDGIDAVVVACEWPDLDPRLGYRNLGGWGASEEPDFVVQVGMAAADIAATLRGIEVPVAFSAPTLALPPSFHTVTGQSGSSHAALLAIAAKLSADVAAFPGVAVVNPQKLDAASPPGCRFDLKTELFAGLPYSLGHASALAEGLAQLIAPPPPKKGLITDLDDTLWNGIIGETGPDGVTWDLHSHSQIHGLYQLVLRALADQGALVAVASKNDREIVDQALGRTDLIIPREKLFPAEVHWNAKSGSVARVLKTWNIGADSVVFVDDSAMELAEVQAAHPGIECLQFPKGDYSKAVLFLERLRDLFGKPRLSEEDQLRRESLRQAVQFSQESGEGASDDFLRGLNATLTVFQKAATDARSLELINKTNQFNLHGRRYEPAEWAVAAQREGAFVWSLAYQDKFGPLGKVAVLHGCIQNNSVVVEGWVMSCRAFARRIEHQCLQLLFNFAGAQEIKFCFQATERNAPLREFLGTILGQAPTAGATLTQQEFQLRCPQLFHSVRWES